MTLSDARPHVPATGAPQRACCECGVILKLRRPGADFCGAPCRTAFHNRRKERGAELYDLLMLHRFERAIAKDMGAQSLMNRMASVWREEDKARRDGRRSWTKARATAERLARFRATRV
jgi:hypothetical protein